MDAGLCETCRHVQKLSNARGSVFYLCSLAESDPRFTRYPRLPVRNCPGYAPAPPRTESGKGCTGREGMAPW